MINNIGSLLELIDSLEIILKQYCSITNLISVTDAEDIDEVNRLLEERQVLITDIQLIEPQIIDVINLQVEDKNRLIMDMFGGKAVISVLSDEERQIQQRVINIRSLQSDILVMDENNEKRLRVKYAEVKEALTDLKNDKKKIEFCTNAKFNMTGKTFNKLN